MSGKSGKKKIIKAIIASVLGSAVIAVCTLVVMAYFSSQVTLYTQDGTANVFTMGLELNTFFDMLGSNVDDGTNLDIECTDTNCGTEYISGTTTMVADTVYYTTVNEGTTDKPDYVNYYVYNSKADWGSASNPYIISRKAHLQNLYVLQNVGYFEKDIDGVTEADIPYFLVCKTTGEPETIDCTDAVIEPIGNENYPFIGYLGGAFVSGTTTVESKTSTQSVIYNATVQTTQDVIDVGLFGHIGYLGQVTENSTTFKGTTSTVRDLLLYDVKVVVDSDNFSTEASAITTFINSLAEHLFGFRSYDTSGKLVDSTKIQPHENHHIGILAGHVELATVEYISVYYSDDNIAALTVDCDNTYTVDSSTVAADFKSISGILGFCYEMNSVQSNGTVTIGGISNEDIEVNGGGAGTGGGELSGTGRGYVCAKTIFENYYTSYSDGSGTRANTNTSSGAKGQQVWQFVRKGQLATEYGVMIDAEQGTDGNYTYTLHEDATVSATITKNSTDNYVTVSGNNWTTYIICDITDEDAPVYTAYDGSELTSFSMIDLVIYDAVSLTNGTKLCTEYVRDRILWGTDATGMYYFYDGVFTFALSDASDVIEDTWEDNTPDTITLGNDDADQWTTDASGQSNAVVIFAKQVETQKEFNANSGKKIFIAYKDSAGAYHLVTLAANSTYTWGNTNDAVYTPATELSLVDSETKATLRAALDGGYLTLDSADEDSGELISESNLKEQWDDISIFDVGGATGGYTLDQIRNLYQISTTWNKPVTTAVYEDDGVTVATDTLKSNSQNVKNTYYEVDTTIEKNYTIEKTDTTDEYTYFLLGENSKTVDVSKLNTDISTVNSTYYEDNWATKVTDSSSPLSKNLTIGTALSQTEGELIDGYWYWYYNYDWGSYYKYVYMKWSNNSSGEIEWKEATNTGWIKTSPSNYFKNTSSTKTIKTETYTVYTKTTNDGTFTGRMYYFNNSLKRYAEGMTSTTILSSDLPITSVSTLQSGCLLTYTATYDYIVATLTGNGMVYYWNGTTKTCSNVVKTETKLSSINNWAPGIYYTDDDNTICKDYDLYTCTDPDGNTKKVFMITQYKIDGYWLKSQTGTGIKYTLNGSSTTPLSSNPTQTLSTLGTLPNIPTCTLSLGGHSYALYTCNSKLVVRLANYALDGYVEARVSSLSTSYLLNDTTEITSISEIVTTNAAGNNETLTLSLSNGSRTRDYALYLAKNNAGNYLTILTIIYDQTGGTYEFWHKNVTADDPTGLNDPYVLRLLRRAYTQSYYSVMVGTETYATTASNFRGLTTPTVSNTDDATVTFNDDGSVYISYTINGHVKYLRYDTSNNHFDTADSTSDTGAKLYIFTVEASHDTTISDKIVPVAGTSKGTYSADEYVLYPQSSLTTTANTAGESAESTTSADPTYSLLSLSDLKNQKFTNSSGDQLSKSDLYKQFGLTEEISWGLTINVFNGSWNFGSDSFDNSTSLVAPIGSDGSEANIPKGCIAFKINDANKDGYNIRVIVAIPNTDYYPGETDVNNNELYDLETDEDYYFGIWQTESAGSSTIESFEKTNALEKFELPRSHGYAEGADPANSDYIKVQLGGTGDTYRAYLDGAQILVAYTFTVTDPGVYVIGATNGPMEIVYFSADSTASAGKDGVTSYRMGTIDFVYDDSVDSVAADGTVTEGTTAATKILTVKDADGTVDGTTDYSNYYYASLSLLYTDNKSDVTELLDGDTDCQSYSDGTVKYPNINNFSIYVRRVRTSGESQIAWQAKGDTVLSSGIADAAYIAFSRYAIASDQIYRRSDAQR